jgi:predicted amidohydrolase
MDASPAPTQDRLARAERLVSEAARAGGRLVVLPEIFNTGYGYSEDNYRRAEPLDGPTPAWMKKTAARLGIHLAGSILLLDQDDVYNALLLFAPDGRMWRYDKNYPWGWERAYFRDGDRITVAETELGRLGFMICWDVAHLDLWQRYAGRVDMMVIASCPPDVSDPTFHFPDGSQLTYRDMGPLMASLQGTGGLVFADMLERQAAWLGVPAVNTVGSGRIRTGIPNGAVALASLLPTAPWLIPYLPQARHIQMACDFVEGCKVVDAGGQVLARLTQAQGEAFVVAEVSLADERPQPRLPQPASPLSPFTYFGADTLLPLLSIPTYRAGLRRTWGRHMAPLNASTRRWLPLLGASLAAGLLSGVLFRRRRPGR